MKKISRYVDHTDFSEKWIIWGYPHIADFEGFLSTKWTLPFYGAYPSLNIYHDTISHFSAFLTLFAIKSNVYFLTHQYLIINYSQSKRALSVYVRTVLWIYFSSRRNCGLIPIYSKYPTYVWYQCLKMNPYSLWLITYINYLGTFNTNTVLRLLSWSRRSWFLIQN